MAAPSQISTENRQSEEYHADSDHRAKRKEYNWHVGSVLRRNLLKPSYFSVPTVRQDEAAQMRNIDGPEVSGGLLIRPRK